MCIASIYKFKNATVSEDINGVVTFKTTIKEAQPKNLVLRIRKSDEANAQWIQLRVNKNSYVIRPSYFGKCNKKKTKYQFRQSCDNYKFIFDKQGIFICKENSCVEKITLKPYPVSIQIEGGTMIMERLEIQ
jgi:hypothetical protein